MKKYIKLHPDLFCFAYFLFSTFAIFIVGFHSGILIGWDSSFHLNRIEELAQSIKSGHILSSSGSFAFQHVGLAVNKFYPYLFLYPFALMRLLINPVKAYLIVLFIFVFISFVISYKCIQAITKSKRQAAWFSIIYNNSGYLMLQIMQRADIAAYIALALLPVTFLGIVNLLKNKDHKNWLLFPLGITLTAYSHFLSVIIFSMFIFCFLLLNYHSITLKVIKRLTASIGIVIILTVPIFTQIFALRRSGKIIPANLTWLLNNSALTPSTLFLNSFNNTSPITLCDVNIGIILLILCLICLIFVRKLNKLNLQMLFLGLFFLLTSTKLMPWFIFQHTPLVILQFPWRFLGVTGFCISYCGSFVLSQSKLGTLLTTIILLCINLFTITYCYNAYHNGGPIINDPHSYNTIATSATYADYLPLKALNNVSLADAYKNPKDKIPVYNKNIKVNNHTSKLQKKHVSYNYNSVTYTIPDLNVNHINKVTLPLVNYGQNYCKNKTVINCKAVNGQTELTIKPHQEKVRITVHLK
ncbi:hypothetical protein [Weissella confusa]|uniref:hypothetical protein n=1 Tax=Weissella confusa TaxID=1583 RepID=UPI00107FAD23|nr:hypothetical protein [Weissella confusa]MBJ7656481.1 hypothetical protein [Weissella confusa]